MADLPPPPQPGHMPPPPPPPVGGLPPGYVAYATPAAARRDQPTGLRRASLILFGVVAVSFALVGGAAFHRADLVRDFQHGTASGIAVDDATRRLNGLAALWVGATLAATILVCLWSKRTVGNSQKRNPDSGLSPGLAAGGWWIPIGNLFVPWTVLRKSVRANGAAVPQAMTLWYAFWVAQGVLWFAGRVTTGKVSVVDADAVSKLHQQGMLYLGGGAAAAIATVFAVMAMHRIDAINAGA